MSVGLSLCEAIFGLVNRPLIPISTVRRYDMSVLLKPYVDLTPPKYRTKSMGLVTVSSPKPAFAHADE